MTPAKLFSTVAVTACLCCRGPGSTAQRAAATPITQSETAAKSVPFDAHILVDQFGYRPGDPKVAVIRSAVKGFDAALKFTPGSRYEVRRAADSVSALQGTPVAWHKGMLDESSGDIGWW